jgi:hypothetical protein
VQSRRRSTIALLAAVAVFAGGFALASCGGNDDGEATDTTTQPTNPATTLPGTVTTTTTTEPEVEQPTVVRIRVVNGAPQGGIVRRSVDQGDRVVLLVRSDIADHVHLHGYDIMRDVAPGRPARLRFRATIPGRFEVELEDRALQIADITVRP